jgi:hypothetical protein
MQRPSRDASQWCPYGRSIQMWNVVRLAAPEKVIDGMSVK